MRMHVEDVAGRKSLDRRIKRLVDYVNDRLANYTWPDETEAIRWAQNTIEQGIKNLASQMIAVRDN